MTLVEKLTDFVGTSQLVRQDLSLYIQLSALRNSLSMESQLTTEWVTMMYLIGGLVLVLFVMAMGWVCQNYRQRKRKKGQRLQAMRSSRAASLLHDLQEAYKRQGLMAPLVPPAQAFELN